MQRLLKRLSFKNERIVQDVARSLQKLRKAVGEEIALEATDISCESDKAQACNNRLIDLVTFLLNDEAFMRQEVPELTPRHSGPQQLGDVGSGRFSHSSFGQNVVDDYSEASRCDAPENGGMDLMNFFRLAAPNAPKKQVEERKIDAIP